MVSSPWFAVNVAVASLMVPQNNRWRVLMVYTKTGNTAEVQTGLKHISVSYHNLY